MTRSLLLAAAAAALLCAQERFPSFIGRATLLLPPAMDRSGNVVAFGAATGRATDIYISGPGGAGLKRLTTLPDMTAPTGATAVAISPDGARIVYSYSGRAVSPAEEVRVIDVASGASRTVAVNKETCAQPLCPNCFFTCVNSPHISPDGKRILYAVAVNQPFFVVNADGTGLTRLPVYTGSLAPSAQSVIAENGRVVFTSAAPSGPTFAPSATDVYTMDLDGGNLRQVTRFGNDANVFAHNAAVSADGSTIVFESNYDPDTKAPGTYQIWTVRADGGGLRRLTAGKAAANPSVSADGGTVVYQQGGQVYALRGTVTTALTSFSAGSAQEPAVSGNATRVALVAGPASGGRASIWSVGTDGTSLQPVWLPRSISPNGVAGMTPGIAPSPGGLFSVYGYNFCDDGVEAAAGFPLPRTLRGVMLLVSGKPVPLLAVTPWQINAQLPLDTAPGDSPFQVRFTDGSTTPAVTAEVKRVAPSVFILPGTADRSPLAAAFHAGTAIPADAGHPASAGEVLEIYGTGFGMTDPPVAAGDAAPSPPARLSGGIQLLIGRQPASILFAGLVPGLAGVYQVNAVMPTGLAAGEHAMTWVAGSDSSTYGWLSLR